MNTNSSPEIVFTLFEVRVLAVLAEKESLTPDNYPLSLNALVSGCNQLSSRDPVMSLSESTISDTLQALMERRFVTEVHQAGARVPKYEHRLRMQWMLEDDKLAILTTLMLRGAQTAGEIRSRCSRMHEFSSIEAVEEGLQFLIDKYPPLVASLTRAPGTKEVRYTHLLGGQDLLQQMEMVTGIASHESPASASDDLRTEVQSLREELDALRREFEVFKNQL